VLRHPVAEEDFSQSTSREGRSVSQGAELYKKNGAWHTAQGARKGKRQENGAWHTAQGKEIYPTGLTGLTG